MKSIHSSFIGIIILIFGALFNGAFAQNSMLIRIQQNIEKEYSNLSHISSDELVDWIGSNEDDFLLFDVRERDEYQVSHLDGSIRVDPSISFKEFLKRFSTDISGKNLVFYCSVGRRSSSLASRILEAVDDEQKSKIYNLKHGIFGWHNHEKPLVTQVGKTDFVHPFAGRWEKLIDRKDLIRYLPEIGNE